MGVVYLARDTKLERTVALKFLPPQWCHDEGAKQRFLREAQAASATNHRNICIIHDIEQTPDGQLFIVMARYEGETLKQKLERGPIAAPDAVEIAAEIAEGLAKAHSQGVIHRDIKPSNLIVTEDGVKILDFGLAKLADSALKLTLEGSTLGTVAYMSPEQARGEEADERSDIWALGVVLYEMLSGEPPFKGSYAEAIFYAIKNETPAALSGRGLDVPDAAARIVMRALEKDPRERYQTARDLCRELRQLQGRSMPVDLRTEPLPLVDLGAMGKEQGRRKKEKRKAVTVGVLVLAVAGVAAYLWLARPLPRMTIAVVPVSNYSDDPELDAYRLALTESLISELEDSPNLRVVSYRRVLEPLRRHLGSAGDASTREAVQAIARYTGARFLILPSIANKNGVWTGAAEIRNVQTGTNVATVRTDPVSSSLAKETAHTLTAAIASRVQGHFPVRWPHRVEPRPGGGRFRNLDAVQAFEQGLNAYEEMEFAAARAAFSRTVEQDPQRAAGHSWLSRTALLMGDTPAAEAAAQGAVKLVGPDTPAADRLFANAVLAEARNDRAAAEQLYRELAAADSGSVEHQLELAGFLKRQSRSEQAVDAYHEALRRDSGVTRAHVDLCQLYSALDDYPLSEQHAQLALKRFREMGNRGGEGQALLCHGDALLQQGTRVSEAKADIEAARTIFESLDHRYNLSRAYQYLGYLAARERNYPAAIAAFDNALQRSRQVGNRQLEGLELMNLGLAHLRMGRVKDAMSHFQEGRDVYQKIGDERRFAELDVLAAGLQVDYGSGIADALRRLSNARATLNKLGLTDFEVLSMQIEAHQFRDAGKPEEALRILRQAVTIAKERNLEETLQSLNADIGIVHLMSNNYSAARTALEPAVAAGAPEPQIALARVSIKLGDLNGARARLEQAQKAVETTGELALIPQLSVAQGELALAAGDMSAARLYFAKAAEAWTPELANAAAVEGRCYSGFVEKRAALIQSVIVQSQKLGRLGLEAHCRALHEKLSAGGPDHMSRR
jgi:tetratricopeptide (TPR) repeat protein/TolB-like protein